MRISPLPASGIAEPTGQTGSPQKMAIAKAIASGQQPVRDAYKLEPEPERPDLKRIKMRTNYTTTRDLEGYDTPPETEVTQSDVVDIVAEETKPLSPQLAAMARQRRALQVKERELADRERALSAQNPQGSGDMLARLKSQPLSVLQEAGVTYDQLTEAILATSNGTPDLNQLKEETLKTLDERMNKTLQDRDAQTEQQVLKDMGREAESLARTGDEFELVRENRSVPKVVDLIHRTYKQTGEVLGVREAMQLVEEEHLNELKRLSGLKKVQGLIQPSQLMPQPQHRMRTLTNRDSAPVPMSAKQRAMLAFRGQLKR